MKFLALLLLALVSVLLTMGVMAKLLSPNGTGLTDSEIEAIWLEKSAIEVESQFYTPPPYRITYCGGRPSPAPPIIFLADLPKQEPLMQSPVNVKIFLCDINKEFCNNGI